MNRPLTINNILASSIMVKRKAILVEGVDDVKKYEVILGKSNNVVGKNFNAVLKVHAVETLLDANNQYYQEGCVGVINATTDLRNNHHNNLLNLKKNILGYIDKDVRNHRIHLEALPNLDILYMLEWYSIETFYVNKYSLRPLVDELLSGSKTLVTDALIDYIYLEAVNKTIDNLYYAILDSLKNATDTSYTTVKYGYDKKYGFIKKNLNLLSDAEKAALEADFPQITKSLFIYLDVCKGKWLFESWLENAVEIILNLKHQCGTGIVLKCDFCAVNQPNKCSYKGIVQSTNMHASYAQKVFNEQPFLDPSLNFHKIINRFDLMFI